MRTSKPFSTISYADPEFLKTALQDLVEHKVLQFASFVHHLAESDEKREHNHLFFIPNGQVNTDSLSSQLTQLKRNSDGSSCIEKPKLFKKSDFGNWYFYGQHNRLYIEAHSLNKVYVNTYNKSDFYFTDYDIATELISDCDMSELFCPNFELVRSYAVRGIPMEVFLREYPCKLNQIYSIQLVYKIMFKDRKGEQTQ